MQRAAEESRIPNPDSIQEFKVQTGLYDAAYGRYAGANVSLITKAGGKLSTEPVLSFSATKFSMPTISF